MPSKKHKDGAKVLRLPECVFKEWQTIAKAAPESLRNVLGISTLLRLVDSSGERWEQQVTYIKNATKAISQIKTCSSSETDLDAIRLIVEPIAAVGYLAAVENHSRKFFIPLIEAVAKHTKCARLEDMYNAYITIDPPPQGDYAALFGELSVTQKALAIQSMLDFATGKKIVYEHYAETLQYLVHWLDKSGQGLMDGCDTNKATTGELTSDAQHATKTILVLFTRHGEAAGYRQTFSTTVLGGNSEHLRLYSKLLVTLLDMCYNTSIWVKDCNQVAGMTMAAMLNLLDDAEAARDIVLGWFFVEDGDDTCLPTASKATVALGISPKSILVKDRGWTGRDIPMLSIVRGLVSCMRKNILLAEIPKDVPLVKPLARFARPSNLHEILFYSIQYICSLADLDAPSKIISFESMAMWLTECKMAMRNKDTVGYVTAVLSPENTECLVRYVWDHWDDPIEAVQQKVKNIFENLLDVLQLRAECLSEQKSYSNFLSSLLKDLITMDWHRKVKYALLNCLVPKAGTEAFLAVEPAFIWKCMRSTNSLVLSPQITALLLAFLQKRVEETIPGFKSFKGQNAKITANDTNKVYIEDWIKLWAMPALRSLTADSDLLRRNVSTFILHPLLHMCPQAFWHLLTLLQSKKSELNEKYHLHAFIALLKVARSLDIFDSSAYTEEENPQDACKVPISTLKLAVHHVDPQVRLDVLGLLCESRKAMSKVTSVELNLLRLFLPVNMNCASPDFRQKLCTHIARILVRIRGNLHAQWRTHKNCSEFIKRNSGIRSESDLQQARTDSRAALDHILYMKDFLYWLLDCIITALYPGSSFQRVSTALRLLHVLVKTFGITESPMPEGFTTSPEVPFQLQIATPRTSKVLVDTLTNPFDFNRLLALEILDQFPDPLPGIDCLQDVQDLLWWGLDNVKSARAGESDSGAMIFRLIFNKYVTKLGFDLHPARHSNSDNNRTLPSVELAPAVFTERLMDLLENQIAAAKENLLNAAQHHPMHGTLLALQYVFQELDYNSPAVKRKATYWKATHARALSLIRAACDAVMDVLSNPSPEGNVPASFREMEEAIDNLVGGADTFDEDDTVGPKHQIILSCCWRAVKEASSLLNTLIVRTPSAADDSAILRNADLIESGILLRNLLTTIRHRGAFSAVYPAYVSLNVRLLDSTDAELNKLPARWLENNLDSITLSNISITRRSAGLPLCILAIVSSDRSARKHMLDTTMKRLLKIAMTEPSADADETVDLPQVHAYNIMRTIFMDAKLGKDVLEYASDGYSLAIDGFSSRSWAIRNCSVMLFSTLLQRTFGTKKTKDEHSSVNKLTGREFFTRYPQLHPYLLQELGAAVDQLLASDASGAGIHPGLYPILTLLSRLHPSVMDGSDTVTPMASFVPLVRSCAVSSIYKTREMAARALVPLISSAQVVHEVLSLLDISQGVTQNQMHGRLFQVQFLLRGHLYTLNMRDVLLQFLQTVPTALLRLLDLAFANKLSYITIALLLDIIDEFFIDASWIQHDRDQSMAADLEVAAVENLNEFREKLFEQCIAAMSDTTSDTANIGRSLARRSMAKIAVSCVLHSYTSKSKINDIYYLLDDSDYEVRSVVMDQLNTFIGRRGHRAVFGDAASELTQRLVQKTFDGETNLECFVQAVKLLQNVLDSDFWKSSQITPDAYWQRLVHHLTHKHSQSVTECVIPLMGTLLAQFYDMRNTSLIKDCTETWGSYVVKYSSKYATLSLREATVDSMRCMTRHLLTRSEMNVSTMPIRMAITSLLQDDDVDIREAMATSVSEALDLQAFVQPERAVELVYMRLLELVNGRPSEAKELLEELQTLLIGDSTLKTTCIEEISSTKLLFAKENPNIYKEDIIDAQWAFILSQRLLQSYSDQTSPCSKNLISIAKDLIYFIDLIRERSLHLMLCGPSGFSSIPTIFLAAYKTILAAQLAYDDAASETHVSSSQLAVTKELRDCLSEVRQEDLHSLLWQQLQSSTGLSSKIASYLGRHGEFQRAGLFIIS